MAKDPAFLFYYQDFLVGTSFMTFEEIGAYIKILCFLADRQYLTEEQILKKIPKHIWEAICCKFEKNEIGFYNKRLQIEVNKRKKFTKSRRENLHMGSHMGSHMKSKCSPHMENENENENRNIILKKKEKNNNINNNKQGNFIERFANIYEDDTECSFKADKKDYILVSNLIKKYGEEELNAKAILLAIYCKKAEIWFCRNGFSDYTIGNLSRNWNSIVPVKTKEQKEEEEKQRRIIEFEESERRRNELLAKPIHKQ